MTMENLTFLDTMVTILNGTSEDHVDTNLTTTRPPREGPPPQCLIFRAVYYAGLIGALCLLGILGNTLSILILQKDRGNAVAAYLLQALAVADNTVLLISFLVLSLMYGFLPNVLSIPQTITLVAYMIVFVQPCAFISHTATIWMTMLLAMNRYIAICRPFNASSWCTRKKARIQVYCVYAFAVIYNFPRFFQNTVSSEKTLPGYNETLVFAEKTYISEESLFGTIYTNALYSIVVVLFPLILIIVLNTLIILEMRRMRTRRVSVSSERPIREESITKVMVAIMIMVVCCHLPDRIINVVRYCFIEQKQQHCNQPFYYFLAITNLLTILNSSTNFLVYYILRKSFRKILWQKLCGRGYRTYQLSTTCDDRLTNGDLNMLDQSSIRTHDTCTNLNINNNHNKRLLKTILNNI